MKTWVWVALMALVVGCESEDDQDEKTDMSETVVACEESFARLKDCCPGFRSGYLGENDGWDSLCDDYSYRHRNSFSCDGNANSYEGHILPALTRAEMECILETSCEELQGSGVCSRAAKVGARGWKSHSVEGVWDKEQDAKLGPDGPRAAVCP